jgi:serine phosphatase RsbU (regulator of sigma subunit)
VFKALDSLPIRVKLMATTIALLTFTVGLYGVMNVRDLRRVHDESRTEQQNIILQGVTADALNVTTALSSTATIFLANTAYADLEAMATELRKGDERLVFVRVVDVDGKAVVSQGDAAGAQAGLTPQTDRAQTRGAAKLEFFGKGADATLIVATVPLKSAGGEAGGRVEAGWSVAQMLERNAAIAARVEERKNKSVVNALFVGGLIVLLGVVLSILQSLRISRPLRQLTDAVERIAHGELKERARISTNDEIGVLARNFNYMAERIGVLLTETKEKATLEKELEVARVIQESLLPPTRLIDKGYFQFQGYFKSASICGGDWWSFSDLINDKLLILIGDVTGHGVSSAMITAAAKSCCDTLRHVTEGELTCTFLLEELNKTIYEAANRKFVMTFFATIIDPHARTITFSNAGHNFPLLFRAHAREGEPAVVPLVTRGNRLGDVMESRFLERTVSFEPGDVLLWYTDGLTEGMGKNGEEYGEKRVRRSITATLDKGPDTILERILRDAEAHFANFTRPEDDITLVVGKFTESRVSVSRSKPQPPPPPGA